MTLQTELRLLLMATVAIGIAALSLITWAFALIAQNGGWAKAMKRTDNGRWPAARWLMLVGALLGVVFAATITWLAGLNLGPWPH